MNSPDTSAEFGELESAEDFLNYFGIPHDEAVVRVHRLHILQRFHDYMMSRSLDPEANPAVEREVCRECLTRAYSDFVHSDARTEKVFAVFRKPPPGVAYLPLDQAFVRRNGES